VNGGWLPPGFPTGPTAPAPAPPPAPPANSSQCVTPMPGRGWTCVNGGWVPPGFAATGGG
jgi:hypothetical protein